MCLFKKKKLERKLKNYIYDFQHNYCCKDVRNYAESFDKRITELEGGILITHYLKDVNTDTVNRLVFTLLENGIQITKTFNVNFDDVNTRITLVEDRLSGRIDLTDGNLSSEIERSITKDNQLQAQIDALTGANNIVVIKNASSETTKVLNSIYKDENGYAIIQFNIGYKSSMTNNIDLRMAVAFDYINHVVIATWKNGGSIDSNYELNIEWNSYIHKFVVAIRNVSSSSDTRDFYVDFAEDGNSATITFAKTNTNYVVGSNKL